MVVDYSKWDKLELSDDSDVEVHPNVDKRSFIRMKQQQIHQKREEMKHNLKQLEISLEMNNDLTKLIQQLIDGAKEQEISNADQAVEIALKGFEKKQPASETNPDGPKYKDMIESLMDKVFEEVKGSDQEKVVGKLDEHLAKLRGIIVDQQKQYEELVDERSKHIMSEDIHTGFDSTYVSKAKDEPATTTKDKGKQKETSMEVLNNPGSSNPSKEGSKKPKSNDDEYECSPEALEFLKIPKGNLQQAYAYLSKHPQLLDQDEKDAMLMVAFQEELEGQREQMKLTVYNAKTVEYCLTLGPDGMRLFFTKASTNSPVLEALQKDVDLVVNHIIERCKVIASERETSTAQDQEPVEQIQLHAVDPNTEITVTVPDGSDPAALEVYNSLSTGLRDAIQTRKLEEINKILADMSVEEAEEIVKKFDECGVLQVEEKIYDAQEWQDKVA